MLMLKPAILTLALAFGANAFATASYFCKISNNPDIQFAMDLGVTHGMGSPLYNASGSVSIRATDGTPTNSRFKFGKDSVAQYWNSNNGFNLVIYGERDGMNNTIDSVEIVVETKYNAKTSQYKGKASIAYLWNEKGGGKSWTATNVDILCEEGG